MGLPIRKEETRYTYGDYRHWPEDERWELINGVAYNMCAAPSLGHQGLSGALHSEISQFLKGKPCRVYMAPVDVFFPRLEEQGEEDVDTVVQPDLVVVCDRSRLRPNGIWGAPDFVVEILSPSTSRKDLHEKYALYERSGVREYWVIDPTGHWLQQYVLSPAGRYAPELTFVEQGQVACTVLAGLVVEVSDLWQDL